MATRPRSSWPDALFTLTPHRKSPSSMVDRRCFFHVYPLKYLQFHSSADRAQPSHSRRDRFASVRSHIPREVLHHPRSRSFRHQRSIPTQVPPRKSNTLTNPSQCDPVLSCSSTPGNQIRVIVNDGPVPSPRSNTLRWISSQAV